MNKRVLFNNVAELISYLREHPEGVRKKMPYRVVVNGETKFVFSNNSDQAIAALARQQGAQVESVSLNTLMVN